MQLRDSKAFNEKWGDAELRVRDNRASIMEEATLETAAADTVGFDRLINRGLEQGFDRATTDLSYKPTFSEPNWFQRNVLRQKPQLDGPVFEISDRPFENFTEPQLNQLKSRIGVAENQLSTNVDSFNTVAQEARQKLEVGEMRMNDVADYINQELQANNERRPLLDQEEPLIEDIAEEDIDEKFPERWTWTRGRSRSLGRARSPCRNLSSIWPTSIPITTVYKTTS